MKIRKITIENNKILWENIQLDFVNQNWKVFDTIIFVWENGSWKSTLLNIIFDFSNINIIDLKNETQEKRTFEVEFNNQELDEIKNFNWEWGSYSSKNTNLSNIFIFEFDLSKSGWEQIKIFNWDININYWLFANSNNTKSLFKSIFSDVSINFNSQNIESIRNNDTDISIKTSQKSSENISTEITQMLVDIYNKDTWNLQIWVDENPGNIPIEEIKLVRTKRFKNAFNEIFNNSNLIYLWVKDLKPIFKKNWKEIEINNLSSWEKQIVFRWWYLLKDKESIKWAIALIDEPEISLHPIWQQKILDFYKYLFKNENWEQTSQIFITTHSPYVLQWYNLNEWWLFVFPWWERVDNLRTYIWDKPSLWVVNYEAYNLATVEFHDELYWYIQDKTWKYKIPDLESYFNWKLSKNKIWQEEKNGVVKGSPYSVTLQTFIRNKLHHPENNTMNPHRYNNDDLKQSIQEMIKIIKDNNL